MSLFTCIGEINDLFLEEAEFADIAAYAASRKRLAKYGALAAVASVGVAVAFRLLRSKRAAA
ncbi:MAG: hypothetical protein FWB91_01205 [Defluviitaleaceae bacterium]|nr:hypothetical protein [Defluviitaleaceae bacterium]